MAAHWEPTIRIIDTHTGGEPTRVVHESSVMLAGETLAARRDQLHSRHDHLRRAISGEPRGSDVMVGAWLTPPVEAASVSGVIFFNNVGYLGMCGHGLIGVAVALHHLGRIQPGSHRVDTPVGSVQFELDASGKVCLENVPSYRYRQQVHLMLEAAEGLPALSVSGDIAWGGNWFFICQDHDLAVIPGNIPQLAIGAARIRRHLRTKGITGADGAEIDHIELIGSPSSPAAADVRNYVMCPGGAYDRSPCGTGTSAKLACLAADGRLPPGETLRVESIIGSRFEASYRWLDGSRIVPNICGDAFVNGESLLVFDSNDPFRFGIELESPS